MWALVSTTDACTGFQIIEEWPEMVDALGTPGVRVVRGADDLHLGGRNFVPDTAGPESLVPPDRGSSLKLGRAEYDDTNRSDKAPAVDALDLIRGNWAAEVNASRSSSWYRWRFFRGVWRFLPYALISSPLFYFGYKRLATDFSVGVPLFAGGALVFFVGGYYVFFVSPTHWNAE